MAESKSRGGGAGKRGHSPEAVSIVGRLRARGATLQQIADELTEQGLETPNGGSWYPSTVRTILNGKHFDAEAMIGDVDANLQSINTKEAVEWAGEATWRALDAEMMGRHYVKTSHESFEWTVECERQVVQFRICGIEAERRAVMAKESVVKAIKLQAEPSRQANRAVLRAIQAEVRAMEAEARALEAKTQALETEAQAQRVLKEITTVKNWPSLAKPRPHHTEERSDAGRKRTGQTATAKETAATLLSQTAVRAEKAAARAEAAEKRVLDALKNRRIRVFEKRIHDAKARVRLAKKWMRSARELMRNMERVTYELEVFLIGSTVKAKRAIEFELRTVEAANAVNGAQEAVKRAVEAAEMG